MLTQKTFALVGAMALALMTALPAAAQDAPAGQSYPNTGTGSVTGDTVLPGRLTDRQSDQQRQRRRVNPAPAAPAAPTPEENMAAAQALATAAGSSCQVTGATMVGLTAEQQKAYEATCAGGPGYLFIASTPPQAFDCIELKGQADQARARDPNADVGQQCVNPVNIDTLAVVKTYAAAAGIHCTVDQAAVLGKSTEGNLVFEAGCADAPGYWLEKQPASWLVTDCLQVVATGSTCQFTTKEEEVAGFQPLLAATDASDCQVQDLRIMGENARGRFYEAKCAAGDGYVARVKDGAVQQVYACTAARRIGGGCTLTEVPPAAEEPAQTEEN